MFKKIMKNDYIWNTIGAITISLTSLLYTMILSRLCDLKDVGVFTFAFSFACTIVTLASFGGRSFQVTDVNNKISSFSYIITRYITVLFTYLLVIIYVVFKSYSFDKSIIILLLCIFKFLEELSDVYYGVLQKKKHLYYIGQCQFVKSIINILIFYIMFKLSNNMILAIISITLVNLLFLLFIERKKAKAIEKIEIKISKDEIFSVLKNNFYICAFLFLCSYLVNSPKYAIDKYLSSDFQAIFNMLIMPATFVLLFGTFIVNPIIVNIAEKYNNNKINEIIKTIRKVVLIVFGLGIVTLIGTYFLGVPILNIIYGLDFSAYKGYLLIIIVGAVLYTITAIISMLLIAMRKIKIQFYISAIHSICAYFIADFMVKNYMIAGGIYSYLIIMSSRFIIYIIFVSIIFRNNKIQN